MAPMPLEDRPAWLASLKVGDDVRCVRYLGGRGYGVVDHERSGKVIRRTPSGRLVVSCDFTPADARTFMPDGIRERYGFYETWLESVDG